MTDTPSKFSAHNPKLQVGWDSTSLSDIMFCPRSYYYKQIENWDTPGNDLEFGIHAANAFETYQKERILGATKDEAQLTALRQVLADTWNNGEPYGGYWESQWHCTGTEPYKNAKGNRAKCPYAHKGVWFPEPVPGETCGECGSPTETSLNYVPVTPTKNRITLVRMLVWYIEEQPEDLDDGLRPYVFPDGTPAVELSWQIPLPWQTPDGESYILAGHFDYIGTFGDEAFIVDNKTTTKTLASGARGLWSNYEPHPQIDTYDLVGTILYPDLDIQGVMLDAAQTMVSGARFGRHPYYKTEAQREEHWRTIEFWIKQAERFAQDDYWPMNKRNCWLCPFKTVCSRDPADRERVLSENFVKREEWNPLEKR